MNRSSSAPSRSKSQRLGKTDAESNASILSAKPISHTLSDKANKPAERKSPKASFEKRLSLSRNPEIQHAQEELAKLREQLTTVEMAKIHALEELAHIKNYADELSNKLNQATETANRERIRAEEMEQASFTAAEDWQVELEGMKKQYEAEVVDLETTKSALENLKQELLSSVEAKSQAVKLAAEAMNAAETTAKRADDLSAELAATKDSLAAIEAAAGNYDDLIAELSVVKKALSGAHAASEKLTAEQADVVAAKEAALNKLLEHANKLKAENESLRQEVSLAKELQVELINLKNAIESLKDELAAAKEAGQKESLAAAEAYSILENTKADIELARRAEREALASFVSVSTELEEAQQNLGTSLSETAALVMKLEFLKLEMERTEFELAEMKDRESKATAEVSALTEKLTNAQFQLSQAVVAEREAQESLKSLSASLQELRKDMEAAKQQTLIVQAECQRRQHARAAVEAEAEIAISEVENTREIISKLEAEVKAAIVEAGKAKANVEADRIKLQAATEELEVAKLEAEAARADIEAANNQILEAQRDTQIAHLKIKEAEKEAQAEMEQASIAKEENQRALSQINHLKVELDRARLETEQALTVKREAESRLKDVLREIEAEKAISESCNQDRNTEHSEAWETAESVPPGGTISVEEYDSLKTKLQETGMLLTVMKGEADAVKASKEELSRKLDDINKEAEASKQEVLHAHWQVEEAQKANIALQDEVQRVITDIKHLEEAKELVEKESFDSGINGTITALSSQEKALHLHSFGETLKLDLSTFHKEEDKSDEVTTPSSIKKKKKKALLLRLGSYLTKIRNQEKQ